MEPSLHAIIDDILDAVRKRTEEINGERVVVEEFVLLLADQTMQKSQTFL